MCSIAEIILNNEYFSSKLNDSIEEPRQQNTYDRVATYLLPDHWI